MKDTIHLSGECFCGAFAKRTEKRDLQIWYPYQYDRIMKWQELVRTAVELGLSSIQFNHLQWGHERGEPDEQSDFLDMCYYCRGGE